MKRTVKITISEHVIIPQPKGDIDRRASINHSSSGKGNGPMSGGIDVDVVKLGGQGE